MDQARLSPRETLADFFTPGAHEKRDCLKFEGKFALILYLQKQNHSNSFELVRFLTHPRYERS